MKAMQPTSARALTVMAGLILLTGLMVMSPSAAFLGFCLAALVVAPAAAFGTGKMRLVAAALLLFALWLAVNGYSAFRADQQRYRERITAVPGRPSLPPRTHGANLGG